MKKIKLITATAILSLLPLVSFAKINLQNNTNTVVTGSINGQCSSEANGIMPPHGTMVLHSVEIIGLCRFKNCESHLYLSSNCTGERVATVVLNYKGIVSVQNYNPERFMISKTKTSFTLSEKATAYANHLSKWFGLI